MNTQTGGRPINPARITRRTALLGALSASLASCAERRGRTTAGPGGTQLTADEVRAVFVGKPWKGDSGIFRFAPDGTYTVTSFKTTATWGPWRYRIGEDGRVHGPTTVYTFYRIGPAYRYHSSSSDAFYLAFPDTEG